MKMLEEIFYIVYNFILCVCIYILILLFVLIVSCNSIHNGSRFNICCILCLKLYYNCNERWNFNKILNWTELLCIIVLYVYMFCYVNKIIETISCLFSLNWNRMFKQWRSINNYSSNRKKKHNLKTDYKYIYIDEYPCLWIETGIHIW